MKIWLQQRQSACRLPCTVIQAWKLAAVCLLVVLCPVLKLQAAPPLPIEDVKQAMSIIGKRYQTFLLSQRVDFNRARMLAATLEADGSWPDIDYKSVSRTNYQSGTHLAYLRIMALAYRKSNPEAPEHLFIRAALFKGLDFWLKRDFTSKNWWHNDIGNPRNLIDILLLMSDELSDVQRQAGGKLVANANLGSVGARPGGDLVQIAKIMVLRSVLMDDTRTVQQAFNAISSEVHLTTDRGMQYDHSFHHRADHVIQTTGYGQSYVDSISDMAALAAGTVFELPDAQLQLLIDYVLDGERWILAFGQYPSPASMNRNISRHSAFNRRSASTPENLMVCTDYRQVELENLALVRRNLQQPAWSGNRYYWYSTYMAQQRPNYYAAVRMFSSRNFNTEGPINSEGLKNHHLADGALFLNQSGQEYSGISPYWDWQKIPGTTVVQKEMIPPSARIARQGLTDFVGGVSDGTHGAAAMDFKSPIDSLTAKKAWFFFDDQIVALGAAIQSDSPDPVVTTLNQTRLAGDVLVQQGQKSQTLEQGSHTFEHVQWVHHDHTGYVLLQPAEVHVRNDNSIGNWRSINHQSWATDENVQGKLFSLWVDHGVNPKDQSYAYVILPGVSAEQTATMAQGITADQKNLRDIFVSENSENLQAVVHPKLELLQAVFYTAGKLNFQLSKDFHLTVSVQEPCMLMIQRRGHDLVVSVSDPTQKLDVIHLALVQTGDLSQNTDQDGQNFSTQEKPAWAEQHLAIDLPRTTMRGQSTSVIIKSLPVRSVRE